MRSTVSGLTKYVSSMDNFLSSSGWRKKCALRPPVLCARSQAAMTHSHFGTAPPAALGHIIRWGTEAGQSEVGCDRRELVRARAEPQLSGVGAHVRRRDFARQTVSAKRQGLRIKLLLICWVERKGIASRTLRSVWSATPNVECDFEPHIILCKPQDGRAVNPAWAARGIVDQVQSRVDSCIGANLEALQSDGVEPGGRRVLQDLLDPAARNEQGSGSSPEEGDPMLETRLDQGAVLVADGGCHL